MSSSRKADRNRCILCGGAPVTRAHIIARPIREVLPTGTMTRDMVTRMESTTTWPRRAEQRTWERSTDILSIQPRVLCGPCNNGWMSALEDRAAPVIAAMITGEQDVHLDVDTKHAIAEWAIAAAIVRGEITTEVEPFDPDLARRFRADGLGELPVLVLAVNVERTRDISTTGPVAWSYFYDLNGDVTGRLVLFWLDRVVFVVATAMLADLVSERLGIVRQAVTLMTPAESQGVWPPRWSSD